MHVTLRKLLCCTLALLLASTPLTRAQQTSTSAPVPPQITSAHSIFIANGGGTNYFNAFTGGPDRGYSQLYAALQQWNRYQIADSPSQADLIFEIHAIAPAVNTGGTDGSYVYNPQLILRILDPKTNALLWTTTSNVKAAGTQSSRDKGFDESVAVLVDRVRQLTGEQLNTTQVKGHPLQQPDADIHEDFARRRHRSSRGPHHLRRLQSHPHEQLPPSPRFQLVPIHPSVLFLQFNKLKQTAAHYRKVSGG